ncbi:MAG: Spy/CpxP family protein refolding chaperone [Candidatus Omnitrophica bacterium]|nr:Spy/CpxP family protein refolding chaperone [Candidatus Omnitrophota bacterium]MBU4477665.1 Spy/CpxP family protein refolding chaperone [Candidatus Omnitrophota bacterium]MCG2703156.1 Spy/CpxP family protein refolding chaperone [Candidatus Omnitrophota bacterium]
MKRKYVAAVVLGIIAVGMMFSVNGYAYGGKRHSKNAHDFNKSISGSICRILMCEDILNLTAEQKDALKDLQYKMKREKISRKADIDLVALDIMNAMQKEVIDTKAINKLIDRKYDYKKEIMKSKVEAYAKIQGILTPEQKAVLNDMKGKCGMQRKMMRPSSRQCPLIEKGAGATGM